MLHNSDSLQNQGVRVKNILFIYLCIFVNCKISRYRRMSRNEQPMLRYNDVCKIRNIYQITQIQFQRLFNWGLDNVCYCLKMI